MDEDAERGIIFTLGILMGLLAMWLILTTRGRRTAQEVFEAAEDVLGEVAAEAGELIGRTPHR